MYDIRQFRPTLYVLLAMGVTGFAIAEQSPGLWILAMGGMLLNAWLVKTRRFIPLPRLLATAATFLAVTYVILEVRSAIAPIFTVGEFLVLLHLVKLYEQRANRDYAQLLVLSLLLMAAAAISTASLFFGILLLGYLFVSLYCCLLFHLKVESDAARAMLARALPHFSRLPEKVNPASLRQDQRRLSASMRRLTGLVSSVSIFVAVMVFLFFPRGAEGLLGHRFWTPPHAAIAGFSEQVTLGQVASISTSSEIVAQVEVKYNGQPWGGTAPLLLRGRTLDVYVDKGDDMDPSVRWEWERSPDAEDSRDVTARAGEESPFADSTDSKSEFSQVITLQPTGTHTLFAMAGAYLLKPGEDWQGVFYPRDAVLASHDSMDSSGAMRYEVRSSGLLPVYPQNAARTHVVGISHIDPRITAYARRPEVSGVDLNGTPLVNLLDQPNPPADIGQRIATAIERHLRGNFHYTLDLSDAGAAFNGKDPLVSFLYDLKRGHCEYFAGAMTLLCQSLGLPARMVVGFASDEFNPVGHFYIVRRSQVHAWVEVLTNNGWETFDPTAANDAMSSRPTGLMAAAKNLFDYLQYEWGAAVVAYGQENRQTLMRVIDDAVSKGAVNTISNQSLANLSDKFNGYAEAIANPTRIARIIALMVIAIIFVVVYYLYDQLRLRRRASRIGLAGMPAAQRQRLARQLGFYDDLLRLLERRGIVPATSWTPLEFSDHLAFLPNRAYRDVRRLTELFYRIRYGNVELNSHRRRRLTNAIAKIGRMIAK